MGELRAEELTEVLVLLDVEPEIEGVLRPLALQEEIITV